MPKKKQLSESIQDYLKAIYELSSVGEAISTNQISERLAVKPASVTGMVKRLAMTDPPLVLYQKHHGVSLTDEGLRISLQLVRKHRLIELFLVKTLAYSWDEVHDEAERLEHAVSMLFCERLANLLGEPDFDPHGDPIPGRDLQVPSMQTISLTEAPQGREVTVRRVHTSDAALLRYLGDMGIQPGTELTVLDQIPFDHTVHVRIQAPQQSDERVLGDEISQKIQVEIIR